MSKAMEHATGLYIEGIRDGDHEGAVEKHTGARYTQHSTGVRTGAAGFKSFFKEFLARNPERDITIVRSIEDGRNVFLSAYQKVSGGAEWVTMDLFDTQEDGRLIEHWDVIEAYTEKNVSGNDMITGPTEPKDLDKTAANKELVRNYVKIVLCDGSVDRLEEFVAEKLIQHTTDLEEGRQGLAKGLESGVAHRVEMLHQLIGQGDMVVTLCKTIKKGVEQATFFLYRVREGLIAEQWTTTEDIPPREQWVNSGKF